MVSEAGGGFKEGELPRSRVEVTLPSPACTWPAGGPQSFAELSYSSKEWPVLNVPVFHARVAGRGALEGLDVNPRDESQPGAKSKGAG